MRAQGATRTALLVAHAAQWRSDGSIDALVAAVIEAAATPLALPPEIGVIAYHWQNTAASPRPKACAALPPVGQAAS